MKKLLYDSHPVDLDLKEGKEDDTYVLQGTFGKVDEKNQNGRIYPREVMKPEIERMQERIEHGSVYGEFDHPDKLETSLKNASHVIEDIRLEGNDIKGKLKILPTDAGKNLLGIVQEGEKVGVSTRGEGSTIKREGAEVVEEDYNMITLDIVADPSVKRAMPDMIKESIEKRGMEPEDAAKRLVEEYPDAVKWIKSQEQKKAEEAMDSERSDEGSDVNIPEEIEKTENHIKQAVQDEIKERVEERVEEKREEIRQEVRSDLLSDPDVALAKKTLNEIVDLLQPWTVSDDVEEVVEEKNEEIQELVNTLDDARELIDKQKDEIKFLEDKKSDEIQHIEDELDETVKELERENERLRSELDEAEAGYEEAVEMGKRLANEVIFEKELRGFEFPEMVENRIDPAEFENQGELRGEIDRVKKEVLEEMNDEEERERELRKEQRRLEEQKHEVEEEADSLYEEKRQLEEENETLRERMNEMEDRLSEVERDASEFKRENDELRSKLRDSVDLIEELKRDAEKKDVLRRAEEEIAGHPRRPAIREHLRDADPDTMEEARRIIDQYDRSSRSTESSELFEKVNDYKERLGSQNGGRMTEDRGGDRRIERDNSRGFQRDSGRGDDRDRGRSNRELEEEFEELGQDLKEIRRLSEID